MRKRSRRSLRIITVCAVTLGGLGVAGALALTHATAPAPRIVSGPGHSTLSRVASFRFLDRRRGVRFLCSVDRSPFRACHSPVRFTHRQLGKHVFRVEARTASGFTSSPARYRWTILAPTPPLVISSPAANRSYNAAQWSATCPGGPGVCGTVALASGRLSVRVAIRSVQTSRYWAGQGYSAQRVTWMTARLFAARGVAGARRRAWSYPLVLPPDGRYSVSVSSSYRVRVRGVRVRVRARGKRGRRWVSGARAQQAVSFTVNTTAPATPVVTPGSPSPSPGPSIPLAVSAQTGQTLSPGAAPATLPLTLSNPGSAALHVIGLNVALETSRLPAGCPADGFQIREPTLPAAGVIVLPGDTVTLATPALGAASIQMLDTASNQDACRQATLVLVLTGSAHS
jgi:hypothetical protein